jgi:hypothetical protein
MRTALLALALAAPAAAAPTLEFKVTSGDAVYAKTLAAPSGQPVNADERLEGADGESRRRMIFNYVATPDPNGLGVGVELQLETAVGTAEGLQLQTTVLLRPGEPLVIARCGEESVRLTLGGAKPAAKPAAPLNYRLAVEEGKDKCFYLLRPGTQANAVGHIARGRRVIFNSVLMEAAPAKSRFSYQLELSGGGRGPVQHQGEAALASGAKKAVGPAALSAGPVR